MLYINNQLLDFIFINKIKITEHYCLYKNGISEMTYIH